MIPENELYTIVLRPSVSLVGQNRFSPRQTCTQWSPGVCGQGQSQKSRDMGNFVVALKLLLLVGKWMVDPY